MQYAILPRSDLTPDSKAPVGRTTFLLVSLAIHTIALPLVYHTVWITRDSQYADLFAPHNHLSSDGGVFSGDNGPGRWSMVHQLAIQTPIVPPYVARRTVQLAIPGGHTLKKICFLHVNGVSINQDQKIASSESCQQVTGRNASYANLGQRKPELAPPPVMIRPEGTPTPPPLAPKAVHVERQQFFANLLGNTRPRELHFSSSALLCADFARPGRVFNGAQVVIYNHWLSPSVSDAFYRAFELQHTLGAGPLRLKGFDNGALGAFERWVTSGKATLGRPWEVPDLRRVKRWVFVMEDGVERSLPATDDLPKNL